MIRDDLAHAVRRALADAALPEPPSGIVLEPARSSAITATGPRPVALTLQKVVGGQPDRDRRADRRPRSRRPTSRTSPGSRSRKPGFVNLYLAPTWLHDVLRDGRRRGRPLRHAPTCSPAQRINLEFVSANPTGPLHAGGGRWVAVGDAIANLLAAQGARGAPRVLPQRHRQPARRRSATRCTRATAASSRPRTATRASTSSTWPRELHAELGDDVSPDDACEWGVQRIVEGLQDDLARIGVHFDTWFSERTLHERDEVADVLARARRAGRRLRRATARAGCASTDFGDSARPRARAQSDGTTTYLCNDLAYHRDKFAPRLQPPDRHLGRRPPRPGEVAAGRAWRRSASGRRPSPRSCSASS